ncbi:YbjQ family protein [Vibrio japonicus]|uniref:UPF0145 protein NP165_18515 n=1 Tax=Vibrio japonicus TaxID=1824638 RepID=A0ABY5LJM9_9VIBR|nr:YbjQ family protein [Vibrio japonicus]UUM32278.1 YbjQ family protein [Vibrio japonicus]
MITTTSESIANHEIEETLGIVSGNVVQSKHIGRDTMATIKSLFGGELRGYTEMMNEARERALSRMSFEAKQLGADAVINVRFTSSAIITGASEVMAYGTAVKFRT